MSKSRGYFSKSARAEIFPLKSFEKGWEYLTEVLHLNKMNKQRVKNKKRR